MGVTRFPLLLLFWAWASISLPAQSVGTTQGVTVYFSEHPPYSMVDGQTGVLVNLTKAILAEAGFKPRFIELPPNRIADLLRSGQREALGIGWLRSAEDEAWGQFSIPIYQERPMVALVNTRSAATLTNPVRLDALLSSGLTLGTRSGTSLGALLDRKVRAQGLVPLETAVDSAGLLRMVQAGRMDYTLMAEEEAQFLLDRDPSLVPGLVFTRLVDPPPGNFRYLVYPGAFDVQWSQKIDAAIERVRNSPRFHDLTNPTP